MSKAIKNRNTGVEAREGQAASLPYVFTDTPMQAFNDLLVPYETYFKSPLAKLGAIKQGLHSNAITDLLKVTGATQSDIAKWLHITEPTLRKHLQSAHELNQGLSEHIIQLFELFDKGLDTFGSLDEFKGWLKHYNLGIDAIPYDLLDTITGISIVISQLIRIDYGVLA
ncbi:putative toxin-antitoxin system antitoxin component, TIGR02293 family [Mucilaginibacter gossypiicola]|uniref:Putative toxin-antitoxin system antitoxin component, TIGR02293 family n=1 Tax=Mucilaginibacter gossypiicola TaxID=551995 RepID=A0A1H8HJX7_9SPHI|nr:antitoxin Xre/MbcA/ParS toxin-binding domain-containing protein [Mucilaginibacter gossypiicola]SEN56532.1 putative toxin-antitoxin system antitoxin component, TIGR02293 family [Mucilaginibacter gossypiicola]